MMLALLFGCLLLVPPVSSKKEEIVSTGNETERQLYRHLDTMVNDQLNAERRQEESFADLDRNISQPGTTVDQHRKFTSAMEGSLLRGKLHRQKVLRAIALKQSNGAIVEPAITPAEEVECNRASPYRTADGSCNNLRHTTWGRASIPMRRFLSPLYDDGIASPRTTSVIKNRKLPSARLISTTVHPPSTTDNQHSGYTHMIMQWGQFLDHDITRTPTQQLHGPQDMSVACCDRESHRPFSRPQCFPIIVPKNDRYFKSRCMNFIRSVQVENARGNDVPVEQLNEITAYIDGSQIYGSSDEEQRDLRSFSNGQLKQTDNLLPKDTSESPECMTPTSPNYCFRAGDTRVNENPTLQSIQTIFMREHNRIATQLSTINPQWADERIFQETRKIVGAILQKITYGDYLPLILGPDAMSKHGLTLRTKKYAPVYRRWIDASIRNVFATAAFRMGHSMIRNALTSYNSDYNDLGEENLSTTFGNTTNILSATDSQVGHYCRGLVADNVQMVDRMFSKEVTDHLFPDSEGNSLDLVALNIQRGRDHGLPSYRKWRRFCRVSPNVKSFADLRRTHSKEAIRKLTSVYTSVDDLDLFPAALTENPVDGGMIGPTFACLLGKQFRALKRGDRFWFEGNKAFVKFTPNQLDEIREASLSRVICDNTDTSTIQTNAFKEGDRVACDTLGQIDLNQWKE